MPPRWPFPGSFRLLVLLFVLLFVPLFGCSVYRLRYETDESQASRLLS